MLTDTAIRAAMRAGKQTTLRDAGRRGEGRLILVIRPMPSGALAEWYSQQFVDGRRALAKLGTYPSMPLAAARARFAELASSIRGGEHVSVTIDRQRRERAELGTLGDLVAGYVEHLGTRTSVRFARYILLDGTDAVVKVINPRTPARDVTSEQVRDWVAPFFRRGSRYLAKGARSTLRAAYSWAMKSEFDPKISAPRSWKILANPAANVPADFDISRTGDRHLSPDEFRRVWVWLGEWAGRSDERACAALRVLMATGQRVREITGLADGQLRDGWLFWDKTKTGKPHCIPLPAQARALLERIEPNRYGLLFPGWKRPDAPFPDASLNWICRRCSDDLEIPRFSPRDIRRTWRTLAGDAGLSVEQCARLMNHEFGPVIEARHYDRGVYADLKRAGMTVWESWLSAQLNNGHAVGSPRDAGVEPLALAIAE